MKRAVVGLTLALALSAPALAFMIAEPTDFSAFSASKAFEARAKVGRGFGHERIEVYGPTPGALLWAASLGSSGEYIADMYVTDNGCVLTESLGGEYRVFTSTGKPGAAVRLEDELTPAERSRFENEVGMRGRSRFDANPKRDLWNEGGRSWVYLRTCWGHILPFNCGTGDLDRSPGLPERIESSLLAETKSWLATAPGSFVGKCPRCGSPCLDPAVIDRLFIIRTHELAEGEPVIRAALAARTSGHDDRLEDELNLVYDPASLASRARRIDFRYPLIGLILFLAGTVWFMWKRSGRH